MSIEQTFAWISHQKAGGTSIYPLESFVVSTVQDLGPDYGKPDKVVVLAKDEQFDALSVDDWAEVRSYGRDVTFWKQFDPTKENDD